MLFMSLLYYISFAICEPKKSYFWLLTSNLRNRRLEKYLNMMPPKKLERFWIYQTGSFQNRSSGYFLPILWKMMVFSEMCSEKKKSTYFWYLSVSDISFMCCHQKRTHFHSCSFGIMISILSVLSFPILIHVS